MYYQNGEFRYSMEICGLRGKDEAKVYKDFEELCPVFMRMYKGQLEWFLRSRDGKKELYLAISEKWDEMYDEIDNITFKYSDIEIRVTFMTRNFDILRVDYFKNGEHEWEDY